MIPRRFWSVFLLIQVGVFWGSGTVLIGVGVCAPIQCQPHERAVKKKYCPPCSPDNPCPCNDVWTCEPKPEALEARQKEEARLEAERRTAQKLEAQRAQAESAAKSQCAMDEALIRSDAERRFRKLYKIGHLAPFHLQYKVCATPCPDGGTRAIQFTCARGMVGGSFLQTGLVACPNLHAPNATLCSTPWNTVSQCIPKGQRLPCPARKGECCLPDGQIVRACGPIAMPGETDCESSLCGSESFCSGCRCLPPETLVDTPFGPRPLPTLKPGEPIFSKNRDGVRIVARVVAVKSVPVVSSHKLFSATLADGRKLLGSASHPLADADADADADGRWLGQLRVGDRVDGTEVSTIEQIPFVGTFLWDVLVDSPTGIYFVGGVPLGSTLSR